MIEDPHGRDNSISRNNLHFQELEHAAGNTESIFATMDVFEALVQASYRVTEAEGMQPSSLLMVRRSRTMALSLFRDKDQHGRERHAVALHYCCLTTIHCSKHV